VTQSTAKRVEKLAENYPEAVPIGHGYRPVPHANGRLEALEGQVFGHVFQKGQPWAPKPLPHANGHLEARVVALEAAVAPAGSVSLPTRFHEYELLQNSRARNMNIKLFKQERRIAALEKKLEEPVAERTRYRKQSRRPSPGPR